MDTPYDPRHPFPELDRKAEAAAQRERANDPNRRDPKGTQGRMDAAVWKLRVRMGLEKD